MKLVIDRKTWLRGRMPDQFGNSGSCLLRTSDQKMCCLGFLMIALGYEPAVISGATFPFRTQDELDAALSRPILKDLPPVPEYLYSRDSDGEAINSLFCQTLGALNDDGMSGMSRLVKTEEEREARIKAEFAKHNIEVEFIN